MVNSNHGHITYSLRDIFGYRGWKSPFSPTVWLVDPLARNAQNINVIYTSLKKFIFVDLNFVTDNMGQALFI